MELSSLYFKGLSPKISLISISVPGFFFIANSVDLDEISPNATFHLGIYFLRKYMLTSIQIEKG